MTVRLPVNPLSQCVFCLRRAQFARQVVNVRSARVSSSSKKDTPDLITVRLEKHVDRYGPKGSYVAVPPGQMRNNFFPRRLARYIIGSELDQVFKTGVSVERDAEFSVKKFIQEKKRAYEEEGRRRRSSPESATNTIEPSRAIKILSELLPSQFDFYRPVNLAASMASSSEKHRSKPSSENSLTNDTPIFGSVSASDISVAIKEAMISNDEATRIQLDEENIHFVGQADGGDDKRVKQLGNYEYEIRIKGAPNLRRSIRVLAETK